MHVIIMWEALEDKMDWNNHIKRFFTSKIT